MFFSFALLEGQDDFIGEAPFSCTTPSAGSAPTYQLVSLHGRNKTKFNNIIGAHKYNEIIEIHHVNKASTLTGF